MKKGKIPGIHSYDTLIRREEKVVTRREKTFSSQVEKRNNSIVSSWSFKLLSEEWMLIFYAGFLIDIICQKKVVSWALLSFLLHVSNKPTVRKVLKVQT